VRCQAEAKAGHERLRSPWRLRMEGGWACGLQAGFNIGPLSATVTAADEVKLTFAVLVESPAGCGLVLC